MNELRIAKDRLLRMCARLTEGEVLYNTLLVSIAQICEELLLVSYLALV